MKQTTDLWFASYLAMRHNIYPISWDKLSSNKARFNYTLSEEQWVDFKRRCAQDQITEIKYVFEKLKDLTF